MLLILAIIIAWLTFFTSLKDTIKSIWRNVNDKTLNITYAIVFFLIAIATTVSIYKQDDEQAKTFRELASKYLDTAGLTRSILSLNATSNKIKAATDSINTGLFSVLKENTTLQEQYSAVNAKLKKQIILENKLLEERSPHIELYPSDMKWKFIDSTEAYLSLPLLNIGGRHCQISRTAGHVYFLSKSKKPFYVLNIEEENRNFLLESHNANKVVYERISRRIVPFNAVQTRTDIALVVLYVNFTDIITNKRSYEEFYVTWSAKLAAFGDSKQDQISLVKELEKKYGNYFGPIDE